MDMFDRLALVDETKTSWKVRVRVSRIWVSIAHNGLLEGSNLILLDEENFQIHAFVSPDLWNNLANVIVEGNIYDVSNFSAKVASGRLRPVHSNICIMFTNSTIVQHVIGDGIIIPMHKFNFSELGDLRDIINTYPEDRSPLYATYVIGVVQAVEQPKMVRTIYGEKELVRFTITDGRFSIKVNVWDEHTASVDVLFQNLLQTPVIIIIASCRLCKFRGMIEIATLPSSKFYINEENEDFLFFRQRLHREGFQPQGHFA